MQTTASDLTTFSSPARTSSVSDWTGESNAASSNDSRATLTWAGGVAGFTDWLKGVGPTVTIPPGILRALRTKIERRKGHSLLLAKDSAHHLVVGDTIQTSIDKADTVTEYPTSDGEVTYSWTQANLQSLGLYNGHQLNSSTFGLVLSCAVDDSGSETGAGTEVDYLHFEADTELPGASVTAFVNPYLPGPGASVSGFQNLQYLGPGATVFGFLNVSALTVSGASMVGFTSVNDAPTGGRRRIAIIIH